MRYWDASAVVPLLYREVSTGAAVALYEEDPTIITWWGTELECLSALCRRERSGDIPHDVLRIAITRLDDIRDSWQVIHPGEELLQLARRMLRVHPLSTGDALQLAAAVQSSEGRPQTLEFVCLDRQLLQAAQSEDFRVLTP